MATDDGWLPLKEAFEVFADRELWQAYQQAPLPAPASPDPQAWLGRYAERPFLSVRSRQRDPFRFDERIRPPEPAGGAREKAWTALLTNFRAHLLSGELMASGIDPRAPIDNPRVMIPVERWRLLKPVISRGMAKGRPFELVDVMVRQHRPGDDVVPAGTPTTGCPKPVHPNDRPLPLASPAARV
jgi:hypothetical protein